MQVDPQSPGSKNISASSENKVNNIEQTSHLIHCHCFIEEFSCVLAGKVCFL